MVNNVVKISWLGFVLGLAAWPAATQAAEEPTNGPHATFRQYCVQCHGDASATAGINLQKLTSEASISDSFRQWKKVATVLEEGRMPPSGIPGPNPADRIQAAEWIRASLRAYVDKHDGDPGRVTLRRLTSAEYAYTIRDLTGVDLDLERHFAGDAVGGEGFANFGDVQFMADANLESYLEVAKLVADHAVIGAGPLQFGPDPGQSGFELSAIHRIHNLYREYGFRAVAAEGGRAFGLEKYGRAFYAAWLYKHRQGELTFEELARREKLSPRFLEHIWSVVNQEQASYPTSEVVSRWQALKPPLDGNEDAVRSECAKIQEFVINWPRWLFAAGALAAGGAGDERALVITAEALAPKTRQDLKFTLNDRGQGPGDLYLSVSPVNPSAQQPAVVVWRDATVQVITKDRGRREVQPLREALPLEMTQQLGFGRSVEGVELGPGDFATTGETMLHLHIPAAEGERGLLFAATVESALGGHDDSVLRIVISDKEEGSVGRPTWGLLASPESDGFKQWKADVLDYAANLPQTSHGEPTPSDRDAIPAPFDNTYNEPERDLFHYRIKYYRQDAFLVDKMLDDDARRRLDQAWFDLMASFDYHDEFLHFTAGKYTLGLEKSIAELGPEEIARIPAEPRQYIEALHHEYNQVESAQLGAQPRHVEDVIDLAKRAWRHPLTRQEQDKLRRLYTVVREESSLDHRSAIRVMISQVLVAPEFLYRLEEPGQQRKPSQLSDWEVASRLSYFLWASVPDAQLQLAAERGELADTDKLASQVRRMIADPKTRRFAIEFFGQWLGFYRFDQHSGVDAKRFPEFTDQVKSAMYDEAVSFFEHVIRKQRPIGEIFRADYTFLNKALAKHYRVEVEVDAEREVEMVEGAAAFQRGGLMRLGAVLTATSAPLRTSPVKRGDWILRRVLGTPTPPPPPDAGSIPADEERFGDMTVREQLESHRRNASCVSCHTRIDPLGFSLEHYDSVGRWRETYSAGQAIEDSGVLMGGTTIAGVEGILDYIDSQREQVLQNMAEKLLGYAFGRIIIASDQPLIDRMTAKGWDATFEEMATMIATSRQFRYRRGFDDAEPAELAEGE